MSKILVKAQQQNVYNLNGSDTTGMAYVLRPVRYTTMNAEDIINYCSANSIVPKAYLSASMIAIAQCIENFLLNGHSVEFPNLGIFSLTSSGCWLTTLPCAPTMVTSACWWSLSWSP